MYEDIKTACLYVRFSSHNQTEQSIEGQTRVCRDFCKRHNIRIVEIYADRATSASKDIEKRVQFLKMIKDSEKGLFDAVIVYKLDRFARSRYDSATYKYRLKRNGVQLISATENISNDPEGIILESVLEGMAEFYSAELSQKINRGMRESAYKHNSIGGAIPLGYKIEDKKLVIDPKTAPIVKEAFEKYADGETVAEICRQFNARGYKTSKGTAFGKSSFTKIFRNERYIGVYSFHDYRAEDAIPAIIDKDLWDRVQLRVGKIKNAPARNKAKIVYLLSGKIFCGHCGSKMNGNCNAGNYYYYQCYGKKNGNVDCKKKNIRKEFIERLVAQDALSLLTDEYIEQIATIACEKNQHEIELDSALPTIRDRIHQVDLSLNNLLKAIESGSAPDMLVRRMGELEKEKKDLQVQAKKESEDIVELDKAQVIYWLEQFRGGSIEDEEFCRMLIDLFVNSVTVWDEDDNTYKVTVAYNLTSLPTKTYRLNKGGTLSDFTSNAPDGEAHKHRIVTRQPRGLRHGRAALGVVHLHAAAAFGVVPVQIGSGVGRLGTNFEEIAADDTRQRLGQTGRFAAGRKIGNQNFAHVYAPFNISPGSLRAAGHPALPHCISRGRWMQGTFPGNGCLSDREAQPRQPVRHVAPGGAAAEALALLPVAGTGQLSQRLPALAEGGGGGGTEGDHRLPCEVVYLHKSVDRPCAAAPPDGIAHKHRVVSFPALHSGRGEGHILQGGVSVLPADTALAVVVVQIRRQIGLLRCQLKGIGSQCLGDVSRHSLGAAGGGEIHHQHLALLLGGSAILWGIDVLHLVLRGITVGLLLLSAGGQRRQHQQSQQQAAPFFQFTHHSSPFTPTACR